MTPMNMQHRIREYELMVESLSEQPIPGVFKRIPEAAAPEIKCEYCGLELTPKQGRVTFTNQYGSITACSLCAMIKLEFDSITNRPTHTPTQNE